jgi:hypothetical protein
MELPISGRNPSPKGRPLGEKPFMRWLLIRSFAPPVVYTFGPAAAIGQQAKTGIWFTTGRSARLLRVDHSDQPAVADELACMTLVLDSTVCKEAQLLVSSDSFVADSQLIHALATQLLGACVLLDMGGHGVARACCEAGVAWRHFRWTTDRAGDTAISQFSWNVRDLARRGGEVQHLLEEVCHEPCAIF